MNAIVPQFNIFAKISPLDNTRKQRMLTLIMGSLLGERIRLLREAQDISLREFAKLLGNLSPAHISDIELGRRYPSSDLLSKIATKLHVPLEQLERLDYRAPVEQLKRFAEANPTYGFALRKMVDEAVSPEEILKFLESKKGGH